MSILSKHAVLEKNSILLVIGILLAVSVGGLVEIVPLFYLKSTIEKVEGMRPYTPLELAGRDIYLREGCYVCHSQMVRPMRDEVERYGHYSLAAESMYDHPFQWGSKRSGPDLARVGGKFSDDWHRDHLIDPRSVVPASIMPGYPHIAERELDIKLIRENVAAHRTVGVPYTDEQVQNALIDLRAQANPDDDNVGDFEERWPDVAIRDFDGDSRRVTEMDALVAYLQVLGTMVDFSIYDDKANLR
ncbi:MAG: cytochrome-c oxidase, cbb3-type subunit II [Pseudomonadota bacterium]